MKKIIIWGTGKGCKSYTVLFKSLEMQGKLKVLGQYLEDNVAGDGWNEIRDIDELKSIECDYYVIGTNRPQMQEAIGKLTGMGVQPEKIINLYSCVLSIEEDPEVHDTIVDKQIDAIKKVLAASEDEVSNYDWMYNTITEFGVYPFDTKGEASYNWTHFGLMQIIEEFTEYCLDLAKLEDIRDAIEVGVYRGRSSYFMCAILSRRNSELKYNMVDIYDNLDMFDRYKEVLPALNKCIPNTSDDFKGQAFDYVFIDADHSYDGSMADYYNLGQYAKKLVAFHDIYGHEYDHENGGTVRSWREIAEINKDKAIKIYSVYPDEWMGIGCVIKA